MPQPAFPNSSFAARGAYEVAGKHIPSISYTIIAAQNSLRQSTFKEKI